MDDKLDTDPQKTANDSDKYFSETGPKLAHKILENNSFSGELHIASVHIIQILHHNQGRAFKKTEYMVIGSQLKLSQIITDPQILVGTQIINCVTHKKP